MIIGANHDNDNGTYSGSAYIFTRNGTNWTQQTKLTPTDGASSDWFGTTVSINNDNVIVGSPGDSDNGTYSGSAYIFVKNGTNWTQQKKLTSTNGGVNHRFGLYDMVMIKDNHSDYAGGITAAVKACHAWLRENQIDVPIEVETRNLAEVKETLAAGGVDRIMLDNMGLDDMRTAVALIDGKAETEASGGITPERVREVAETGVNFISMGALTHSVRSMDISLKAV